MKTSVIISSINRKNVALRLLRKLAMQTVIPDQVILIEAGGLDWNNAEVPRLLQNKFYSIFATKCSLVAARAMGQRIAVGKVLFFFDDDIMLPPTYIENAVNYLVENTKVMAVGGSYSDSVVVRRKTYCLLLGRLLGIYANGSRNRLLPSGWADYVRDDFALMITSADWLFGCNFVVRAEAFSKVRFETKMLAWSFLEDVFFGVNLRTVFGDCMRILPSLKVIHAPPDSGGRINKFTLKMRIIYRFILWRDHMAGKYHNALTRFIFGMIANLLLMIKQEKKFWVIPETIRTMFFIVRYPGMSWEVANEFIFSQD